MLEILLFGCILFPFLAAAALYCVKDDRSRALMVTVAVGIIALSAIGLAFQGRFWLSPQSFWGGGFGKLLAIVDFALLAYILYLAIKARHSLASILATLQIAGIMLLYLLPARPLAVGGGIYGDSLSLLMVLIISLVGGLICIYGLGYMRTHEEHLHLEKSRQPRFFLYMVLFLGAMNGIVLADNLSWLFCFWEITTLCSFKLISHDGTAEAKANALRALWMNLAGGLAFVIALLFAQNHMGTLSIQHILAFGAAPVLKNTSFLLMLFFLCFAGFTKAAQIPFQSWLCGAMVAPTPVSALLHSSTMVKAGVYLIVRLAPAYAGTGLSTGIAAFGAFTFLAAAALAVGQSNAKKVLAYSTISNLGLIIACAGINTAAALTAAMLLIVFHALSKGLLFMCVGTIEQQIGSRNLEDMRGLYTRMPRTTMFTLIGIFTMMLPPFGMLLAKWMALESAAMTQVAMPFMVFMIGLGSALAVLFWARWAGMIMGSSFGERPEPEDLANSVRVPLATLAMATVIISFLAPVLYSSMVEPMLALYSGSTAYTVSSGDFINGYGIFSVYALFALLGAGFLLALRAARKAAANPAAMPVLPYMSGLQCVKNGVVGFNGPMDTFVVPTASNYYLLNLFGEPRLAPISNTVALVLLAVMLGGLL